MRKQTVNKVLKAEPYCEYDPFEERLRKEAEKHSKNVIAEVKSKNQVATKKNDAELEKVVNFTIRLKIKATPFELRTMTMKQLIERCISEGNYK